MGFVKSAMAALLGAALVAGCGGGGGGSSPGAAGPGSAAPVVTSNGSWLTLTPGVVAVKAYEGETARFQVRTVSSRTFDKPFNIAVIDSKGVVTPEMVLSKYSDLEYGMELHTSAAKAGTYTTDLQLKLCEDDPLVCQKPLPGSPWTIPVTVTVATAAQAHERLAITPAALDLVTYQGESLSFSLGAKAVSPFTKPVRAMVMSSSGVLAAPVAMRELAAGQFSADLATASALAVGEHGAALEVRVCYDDPLTCALPVSGSPWQVPFKLTVKPAINLTPLSKIASLSSWSTYNGSATQNAYVPASFDPAAFSRRWNTAADAGTTTGAPVIENGKVFIVRGSTAKWELSAASEASGEVLWRYDLGAASAISPLAAANGRVFARSSGADSALWVFDEATGALLGKTRSANPYELYRAPSVIGDMAYMATTQGVEKFNTATGLSEWKNTSIPSPAPYFPPAVDDRFAYTIQNNGLFALDATTGGIAYSIQEPVLAGTSGQPKSLVVGANLGVAKIGSKLVGIDLQTHLLAWTADSSTVGQHVLVNDTLYSLGENGMVLEARSAASGVLQWKTGWLFSNSIGLDNARMIVTSNLVFVSGPAKTLAVDRTTHQVVWTTPFGGELAISDQGVLYIVSSAGSLFAINLR
jgi:outer membrane protein assembly factor BamB